MAAGKPVAKELAVIRKNTKQFPSISGSEPSVKISEKDFNRLMDMAQASGTLEKLNEIYDRELEHMQGIINNLMVQVKTWKDKVLQYDKLLNVKGLFEKFKEFTRTKPIKVRMEDKQKNVKTQKQEQEMKPVQRKKGYYNIINRNYLSNEKVFLNYSHEITKNAQSENMFGYLLDFLVF